MDASGLDGIDPLDRATELAFEGALEVHPLGELGHAEVLLVEDLEPEILELLDELTKVESAANQVISQLSAEITDDQKQQQTIVNEDQQLVS